MQCVTQTFLVAIGHSLSICPSCLARLDWFLIINLSCLSIFLFWLFVCQSVLPVCFGDLVFLCDVQLPLTGRVLATCWNTACYKSVCLICEILFCNLLTCSVLHEPTFLVAIGHRMQCPSVISLAWLIVCLVCLLWWSDRFLCDGRYSWQGGFLQSIGIQRVIK